MGYIKVSVSEEVYFELKKLKAEYKCREWKPFWDIVIAKLKVDKQIGAKP